MPHRSDKQKEKEKVIQELQEYGLVKKELESIELHRLKCTLRAIKKEMKDISKNTKIVFVNTNKDENSDSCSFCDTEDSECEYCDTDVSNDTEIDIDSVDVVTDSESD